MAGWPVQKKEKIPKQVPVRIAKSSVATDYF